jgi:hypothetical protein
MSSIFPEKAFAWSGANDWLGVYPTHQEILKAAYKLLKLNDGPALENSRFPGIDDILKYEGMGWTTNRTFDIIGTNQYNILGPGPDDETKTDQSAHDYNPETAKGGGPDALKTYFSELFDCMYASSSSPGANLSRGAAWSSHFISDMCVPYHVVGMPGADVKSMELAGNNLLPEKQTGPSFLCSTPDSPKEAPAGFGKDGNFAKLIRRYLIWSSEAGPKANRDWFDPWYYNGGIWIFGWGWGDFVFLRSSHVEYEKYAHTQYIKSPYVGQETNVPPWANALPTWDNPYGGQEQLAQNYARMAAKITRDNLEKYWKAPAAALYNAVELSYTLWRSSISALKPKYEVTPIGTAGSKTYKVNGTILNVAKESAVQVQARLSIDGGKIINNARLQPSNPVDLNGGRSMTVTWDITTDNIDNCKIKLEVIGQYHGIPDLQYAVAESNNANIAVSISPSRVDAGKEVLITVKLQPGTDTPPTVIDWGPLEHSGNFSRKPDGTFEGKFTVKKDAKDKTYTVSIQAIQLNLTGSANITVGKAFDSCTIDFQIGVPMGGDGNPTFTHNSRFMVEASGSFTGQTFEGTVINSAADNYQVIQGGSTRVKITMTPTADPKVFQITDYQLATSYTCTTNCPFPIEGTLQASGNKALQAQLDTSRNVVTGRVSGESARSYIDGFNWTVKYQSTGTKAVYNKIVGTPASYFQITFQNK